MESDESFLKPKFIGGYFSESLRYKNLTKGGQTDVAELAGIGIYSGDKRYRTKDF